MRFCQGTAKKFLSLHDGLVLRKQTASGREIGWGGFGVKITAAASFGEGAGLPACVDFSKK
jgi:hypothetical protein